MNILYVCTWNIFRSMSAEYLSKKYISDNNIPNISVASAGTKASPESPFPQTLERLALYWCDASGHHQTKISTEILSQYDLIICMAEHHRDSVRGLWFEAVLFNEIAYDKTENVLDDTEYMEINGPDMDLDEYIKDIVDYIYEATPFIIKNIITR
ncbi:MAG: hypothetical protein ACD_80C00006G0010 [uncultured bacterium (gcode 4)]|uniref:Phosphotyrosine protein phosphatase I domain-containing protein n=1 Tax=uncultured bacterium (gcode 4) TaxID=1234023 RepID=K1XZD0_9BACT|nr:MAG: hypothetical protein ACD_80C00006G0010 [uncultured bacterium (gcode 4)]